MDHTHGCYGATSALLAAADWVAGPRWDGGLALVVGADVAVYPAGSPARPTGEGRAGVFASVGVWCRFWCNCVCWVWDTRYVAWYLDVVWRAAAITPSVHVVLMLLHAAASK